MARRRREGLEVSLFPFLSILACVIGTLTLILASMAVSHVGSSALAGVRLGEKLSQLQQALVESRDELDRLEEELETAQSRNANEDVLHNRLKGLGLDPEIRLEDLEKLVNERRQSSEAALLLAKRARLESERRQVEAQLEGVRADVAARKNVDSNLTMRIAPSGSGPSYRPYFVECTSAYIEVHTARSDFKYRVPREDIERGDSFQRFLARIRVLRGARLVFLVRPEGVATYKLAAETANRASVSYSKMPLPGEGELDFSLFDDGKD